MSQEKDKIGFATDSFEWSEKIRILWLIGDWEKIVDLQENNFSEDPDKICIALYIASALFQIGNCEEARKWIEKAHEWGGDKNQIGRILISGVYNNFGRFNTLQDEYERAEKYYSSAISIAYPVDVVPQQLLSARIQEQKRSLSRSRSSNNVFVLGAGRCGTKTFVKACSHMTNYTSSHESRCSRLGDERLAYPPNHIEVDNRLSWFLGRLERVYGDGAVYVHLVRDQQLVAESYNKRWTFYGSIVMAYTRGILMSKLLGIEPVKDYVRTVSENIEHFLFSKTHVFRVDISGPKEVFKDFWCAIGAEGDLGKALKEFDQCHNLSKSYEKEPAPPSFQSEKDQKIFELKRVLKMIEQSK